MSEWLSQIQNLSTQIPTPLFIFFVFVVGFEDLVPF
jgi:hypothetical protein